MQKLKTRLAKNGKPSTPQKANHQLLRSLQTLEEDIRSRTALEARHRQLLTR